MARKTIPEMYVLFYLRYRPKDIIKYCDLGRGTVSKAYTRWNKETRLSVNRMEQQIQDGKARDRRLSE